MKKFYLFLLCLALSVIAIGQNPEPGTYESLMLKSAIDEPATQSLSPIFSMAGNFFLSADAVGSNSTTMNVRVEKPSDNAVVYKAFLFSAVTFTTISDGCVSLAGIAINWNAQESNSFHSNYWADVTTIVATHINPLPAGISTLPVTECSSGSTEGESLLVIFMDPGQTEKTIAVLWGGLAQTGDNFGITLNQPIDPSNPASIFDMGLGISFGYQQHGGGQYSIIDINNQRLTTSAGGEDDGQPANGALITVGGIGDDNTNPADPNGLPVNPRSDDELYNLLPFITNTTTTLNAFTQNPSNDDNIFLAYFVITGKATVDVGPVDECVSELIGKNIDIELYENGEYVLTPEDIMKIIEDSEFCSTPMEDLEIDVFPKSFECIHAGQAVPVTVTVTEKTNHPTSKSISYLKSATTADNKTMSCTATVTVKDVTAPVAACHNLTVNLDENGEALIMPGDVNGGKVRESTPARARSENHLEKGSWDACGVKTLKLDKAEFSCEDVGTNIVVLTATDPSGNASTCEATVTIVDDAPPTVSCVDTSLTLDANGQATLTPEMVVAASADLCGVATIVVEPSVFDCSMVGENDVKVTVTDVNGNVAECDAKVTVADNIPPEIAQVEDVVVVVEPGTCVTVIEYPEVLATDNCAVETLTGSGFGVEGLFPLGTTVEKWDAVDASGNKTSMSFNVIVNTHNAAPTVDTPADQVIMKDSGDVVITLTGITPGIDCDEEQAVVEVMATSSDGTIVETMVTYNAGEETATVTLKPMAVGEVDITIKVMDNGGIENGGMDMTETTFKVAVVDNKMAVSATEFKNNLFVKLYPNPTKDIVQLDLGTNPANHVDIAVFTTTGEQIIHKQFNSGENVSFNMNNHVSGMYFVKVMVDGKQTVKKLILDRR